MMLPCLLAVLFQAPAEDKAWAEPRAELRDALEAERIIRVGDVDNLGFGFPEGFDPFCGKMSEAHGYPWEPKANDLPGFDRILLSSRYKNAVIDGYSAAYDKKKSKPVPFALPLASLRDVHINNAWLQLFIDDFQAPSLGSRFSMTLFGRRFVEGEKILNAIDQTGPVGKLISLPLPEEFFEELSSKPELVVSIDEATGAGDGYAIDFVRLLVNRKREHTCKGTIKGRVVVADSETPIAGARVYLRDSTSTLSDSEGVFELKQVPTGFELVGASAVGYADGSKGADVGVGDDNAEVIIPLRPGKAVRFDNQALKVGEALTLKNILFDLAKATLKPASTPELDKVVKLMKQSPSLEIELSGHTSSEGEATSNRSLSYRRVKACKDYLVKKGIDEGRVIAVGYGADRPVAPNDSEANRKLNRRVEMRVTKE